MFRIFQPMSFDLVLRVQQFFSFQRDIFVSINLFLKRNNKLNRDDLKKTKYPAMYRFNLLCDDQQFEHVTVAFVE